MTYFIYGMIIILSAQGDIVASTHGDFSSYEKCHSTGVEYIEALKLPEGATAKAYCFDTKTGKMLESGTITQKDKPKGTKVGDKP